MTKKSRVLIAAICALAASAVSYGAEPTTRKFRGVVTYYLNPAKVMRLNTIVEDPAPGASYIGNESILVELDGNIDVMANWTVVEVDYYEYEKPKVITYEIGGKQYEVTVENHAVSVRRDGDLSRYIPRK